MLIIILSSVAVHLVWSMNPVGYLGSLIWSSWAFVWLPVVFSYLLSGLLSTAEFRSIFKSRNYNIDAYQRYVALFIGGSINIVFTNMTQDMETAGWVFLMYVFLAFPIQLAVVLVVESILFLIRKYGK